MKVEDSTFIVGETKAKTHLESQLIAGFSFTVEKSIGNSRTNYGDKNLRPITLRNFLIPLLNNANFYSYSYEPPELITRSSSLRR